VVIVRLDRLRLSRRSNRTLTVENSLHWVLDVAYGEDQARMREGNSAENFSILRRITLNLLRLDRSVRAGVKNRRLLAGWDDAYRQKLLGMQPLA